MVVYNLIYTYRLCKINQDREHHVSSYNSLKQEKISLIIKCQVIPSLLKKMFPMSLDFTDW